MVVADPVFETNDPRLAASGREVTRGEHRFGRLLFSRAESEQIAKLGTPGSVVHLTDFAASLANMTSEKLGRYRMIHFATHGVLDNEHPELSGLVLSQLARDGGPVDGFLRLNQIYNLKLRADLVVLSACETALGSEIKGEGLIGLTRGFMYAGTRRVVASLWKVDDVATSELMKRFYRGLLTERRGVAEALRLAQSEMQRDARWRAPYYWAGFTLQGD
jgi:CHAT domain-containing protein